MPELPEVETVRRTLAPVKGRRIRSVWTSGLPLRLGQPVPLAELRRACVGGAVERVDRRGKYLLVYIGDRPGCVVVHLGMSGRLRLSARGEPRAPHTHVVFSLDGGGELRFSDPRRFGAITVARRGREREHPSLARLGEDPLEGEVTGDLLYERAHKSGRTLKSILLDQQVVAGVGNIYASEALFESRIKPSLRGNRLSRSRANGLAAAIRAVLERALDHGGTSLRDFVAADGARGEHAHYLWVYGREGETCVRRACSGRIRRVIQQGRATFYCPRCQDR